MIKNLLFTLILFTSFLQAQNTGSLTGYVFDEFGKPISDATIAIENSDKKAISDDTGFFKIEEIIPKSYNISASATNYESDAKFNIIIKSVGNIDLIFNLKAISKNLEEVTVTKNPFKRKKETPLSIQSLSPVEIASYPGGNNDIAKVVQSLPGVSGSVGGFRNDVIIRGGAPNENVYYLDGIEIPNINHFSTQGSAGGPVGMLNVSFIDGVTLSTSSFESKYDNVLSGVLQFNQRKGNNKKFQGNARISASEAALTVEGPMFKGKNETSNTTYIASVRRSYLQFLFEVIGLPIRPDYWDYQYKLNHKIDEFNEINFLGIGSIDDFSVKKPKEFSLQQQSFLEQVPIIKQWSTTSGLSWKKRFKDSSGFMLNSLSTNILNNNFRRFTDNENLEGLYFTNNSKETEVKFRNEVTKNINDWKLVAGFNIISASYNNTTSIVLSNLSYETKFDFLKYGLFAQASTTFLNDRFDVSLGFRTDANSFTTQKNQLAKTFSPRISLSYALTEDKDWRINATLGNYYKIQPYTILGYKNNVGDFSNKDAEYTGVKHYVLGVSKSINKTTQVSVEGFYKKYGHYAVSIIDGVSLANKGGDFEVLGNEDVLTVGNGKTYGMEFTYQQKLTKNFFGILAYTLFTSQFSGLDNVYRSSVWDSRNLISFTGGYKFKRNWETGIRYRYSGKTPYAPVNQSQTLAEYPNVVVDYSRIGDEKLSNASQLDIRIDKKWNFKKYALDVFIDVQNILQQQIPNPPQYSLNRNETTGDLVLPESLVRVPDQKSASIPTIGIILDF
jgi:TonB-dependent Receptor Plug Domain/CarboxypepD_reg-like domain